MTDRETVNLESAYLEKALSGLGSYLREFPSDNIETRVMDLAMEAMRRRHASLKEQKR